MKLIHPRRAPCEQSLIRGYTPSERRADHVLTAHWLHIHPLDRLDSPPIGSFGEVALPQQHVIAIKRIHQNERHIIVHCDLGASELGQQDHLTMP